VLAAGQPGGIFGAFKTLKTSLAADLMISLASGTPFLGRFPVPQPGRVLFLSGESGLDALQSIARRICTERGLSLETLDNFVLSPDLPRLDRPKDVLALKRLIEKEQPICVVIDPAYLAMGGDNSRNLFAMGQLLRPLTELCESTGCTILLAHHCKRSSKVGLPATLDDIASSGIAEFSAQWLLLARRRPFDPGTGKHELWLTAGSRAGHHGLWELDVDEGTVEQPDGRRWKTSLRPVASAETQIDEQFVAASEDRRLRRRAVAFGQQRQRVWEVLGAYPDGCNATAIRDALGINGERMARILQTLVDEGAVIKTEDQIDRRRYKVTYRRRIHPMDLSQAAAEARRASPRDQKVYDVRSGQFVDPPKLVRANAADLRHAPTPAAGTIPLADKPPVPPAERALPLTQKSGPDTFANGQGTANQHHFVPTPSDPSRIPAPPPSPARTAPGAGASPLPEDAEEFLRAMNKPAWWDRRPRNSDGTVQTDAQAAASAAALQKSGPDTFAERQGTAADPQKSAPILSSPSRIPASPSIPAPAAPGAGAWPLQIGVHYIRDGKIEKVPPPTFRGGR
jgi:predicted transcriptional regulator